MSILLHFLSLSFLAVPAESTNLITSEVLDEQSRYGLAVCPKLRGAFGLVDPQLSFDFRYQSDIGIVYQTASFIGLRLSANFGFHSQGRLGEVCRSLQFTSEVLK